MVVSVWEHFPLWLCRFENISLYGCVGLRTFSSMAVSVWEHFPLWLCRFENISLYGCVGLRTFHLCLCRLYLFRRQISNRKTDINVIRISVHLFLSFFLSFFDINVIRISVHLFLSFFLSFFFCRKKSRPFQSSVLFTWTSSSPSIRRKIFHAKLMPAFLCSAEDQKTANRVRRRVSWFVLASCFYRPKRCCIAGWRYTASLGQTQLVPVQIQNDWGFWLFWCSFSFLSFFLSFFLSPPPLSLSLCLVLSFTAPVEVIVSMWVALFSLLPQQKVTVE